MTMNPLVMVHIVTEATVSYSHGLASLAGVLRADARIDVEPVLYTIRHDDMSHAATEILCIDPIMIFVSAMSNQWERATRLAMCLKREAQNIPLCIGGSHVSASPESVLKSSFDVGVVGEAENLLGQLTLPPRSICDVVARYGHIAMPLAPESLDDLPHPAIDLFPIEDILAYPSVMFSRGCPYACSYCMSRNGG